MCVCVRERNYELKRLSKWAQHSDISRTEQTFGLKAELLIKQLPVRNLVVYQTLINFSNIDWNVSWIWSIEICEGFREHLVYALTCSLTRYLTIQTMTFKHRLLFSFVRRGPVTKCRITEQLSWSQHSETDTASYDSHTNIMSSLLQWPCINIMFSPPCEVPVYTAQEVYPPSHP